MAFGQTSRAIGSPIGSGAQTSPYGTTRGPRQPAFVPLSVFFLQLAGQEEEDDAEGNPKVKAFRVKRDGEDKEKKLGPINFDSDEKSQTRAMKGPRPKARPKNPLPKKSGDFGEAMTTANVATVPRPIGQPLRRLDPKRKKRWMEGLSKLMAP